ncbi:hypothetical protein PAECIP111891_05865 [Paenibacillus allorhizoplanae]|uniref:Uncharacterized protein n=1 Tax=Paenibacillus allorhizoplanae TaxID=2905648 RepID=A0ABM9CY55_9BACL|nr:hypothetical protein PAECIP111891_05865 [Paenibacillus allorhizoplanae]
MLLAWGALYPASYANGIYYHEADRLYIAQYAPSSLDRSEMGIAVEQETKYPEEGMIRFRNAIAFTGIYLLRKNISGRKSSTISGIIAFLASEVAVRRVLLLNSLLTRVAK